MRCLLIRWTFSGLYFYRTPKYQGPCSSVLKLDRVSWTVRSRSQENSTFSSRWYAGKALLFPFPSALRSFLAPRRAYGLNAFQPRHSVCIRESTSPALCHSQGYGRKIGQAVEGLWRLKAARGPDYSTLIHPPIIPSLWLTQWHARLALFQTLLVIFQVIYQRSLAFLGRIAIMTISLKQYLIKSYSA